MAIAARKQKTNELNLTNILYYNSKLSTTILLYYYNRSKWDAWDMYFLLDNECPNLEICMYVLL